MKPRRGPPQKPPEKRKSHTVTLRLTPAEFEKLQTLAKQKNTTKSKVLRKLIFTAETQRRKGKKPKINHRGTEPQREKTVGSKE